MCLWLDRHLLQRSRTWEKQLTTLYSRSQKLVEHCDYDEERDNQVRDHAISYVTSGRAVTLLGRKASEVLELLKVRVSLHVSTERKALLKAKFPKVFQGLGKFKGYQLKFHIDPEVEPIDQPVRRIPFSRRSKVIQKIEELVELDVIEKVEGPSNWLG